MINIRNQDLVLPLRKVYRPSAWVLPYDPAQKKFLISRRRKGGSWNAFGGGIEKGEAPKRCAMRELREESSLRINKRDLILPSKFIRNSMPKNINFFLCIMYADDVSEKIKLSRELTQWQWLPLPLVIRLPLHDPTAFFFAAARNAQGLFDNPLSESLAAFQTMPPSYDGEKRKFLFREAIEDGDNDIEIPEREVDIKQNLKDTNKWLKSSNGRQYISYAERLSHGGQLVTVHLLVSGIAVAHASINKATRRMSNVYTHPNWRNKGYATQLLTHILESPKLTPSSLFVRPNKENAVLNQKQLYAFYGKFGFRCTKKDPRFMERVV